ncbi:MAG TPA: RecX family transcriptional regulator [Humisphaera sp.]
MPTITRIAEQKRRKNRRSVYLDGAFAFGCNVNVIARFRLREGLRLTPEQVAEVLAGGVRQECLDDALRMLQSRLHSRSEVKKKLARKEYGPQVIDAVLADLERLGYLNDAEFAKAKATSAAKHKHHGARRAKVELMRKGVDPETAEKALADVYDAHDSLAVAKELARKQAPRLSRLDPQVARRRLVGMLQRRGFDYEMVKPVVDEVLGEMDEAGEE